MLEVTTKYNTYIRGRHCKVDDSWNKIFVTYKNVIGLFHIINGIIIDNMKM